MHVQTGKKRVVEALWRDFFLNTSKWWDHRPEKMNPRFPDFKHKQTQESLWLADPRNPSWVQAEVDAIPSGTLQINVFAWARRLKRYVKAGQYRKTMEVFHKMEEEKICPDTWTFLPVLNACAGLGALEEGKRVHTRILQVGCEYNVYVGTGLVDMYAKCGSIGDAWNVFSKMQEHNVVTWNAMIGGYVKSGQGLKAMELFWKMQQEKVEPDAVTFVGVLNACASVAALEEGRCVHQQILQRGCESDTYVVTCLVDMYAKCGSIEDAWIVFNNIQEKNICTWSAMIGGYAKSGHGLKAMELYRKMEEEGLEPDTVTFMGVLHACASVAGLGEGRRIHAQVVQGGWESDIYVANCLVDMYAKCGSMDDAWSVFTKMGECNVVTWNAIIGGYVKSGQGLKAIELFWKMHHEGVEPDTVTFVGVLNACASTDAFQVGKDIHGQIIRRGCESDIYVANCLVDMYAKCGSIEDAWTVFKEMQEHNVVSWSAMIVGCVKSGQALKAKELFWKMQQEGVEPDPITFVGVLNACASLAALEEGRRVHQEVIRRGCESDVYVSSSLVDMYVKCGNIEDAWTVFTKIQEHNVVTWSSMIGGYAKSGQGLKAIELFQEMQQQGVEPNSVTFVGVLNACASVAALGEGRHIHGQIIVRHYESDVYVGNSLVDMYAKCGSIEDAHTVFKHMPTRDVVTWTAMIGGYALHGYAKEAIGLFKQMAKEGLEMNGTTFTCILSACGHVGLVKEALRYFKSMGSCFNILPTREHYSCVVDLLGRAGQLGEAKELMKTIPFKGDACVWMSLLSACRIHANIEMAEWAAKQCSGCDHECHSGHVLLSNVYAAAGK